MSCSGKKIRHITLEEMQQKRAEVGFSAEASQESTDDALNLLFDAYNNHTTKFMGDDGEETGLPTKKKDVFFWRQTLKTVLESMPTNAEVIEYYNEAVDILNGCQKRVFAGSWWFIGLAIICAIVICIASEDCLGLMFFIPSIAIYWLGSMKPAFVLYHKELKGKKRGKGFMDGILGAVFGVAATASTYKIVTKWSDGTTTTETDNTESVLALIFILIMCLILVYCMIFIGLINYIRNYFLYI